MRYEHFVRLVESRAAGGLGQEKAETAIAAVLTTLAQALPRQEAADLAAQLPIQLKRHLRPRARTEMSVEEFLRRVADREELTPSEALHHARAVMHALSEAVTGHELARARAGLPGDFELLFRPTAADGWPETHTQRPHP